MLSQFSSLRHTLMALVTIASLMGLVPYSVLAAPMTYEFTIEVEAGTPPDKVMGKITGRFIGEDSDNSGFIEGDEVTVFTGDPNNSSELYRIWTNLDPNPFAVPASFTIPPPPDPAAITDFTNPDVFQFKYEISSETIILLSAFSDNGVIGCGETVPFPVGLSCNPSALLKILGSDGTVDYTIISQSVMPAAAPVAAVPEPSTAILLSLGLVGMILYAFSQRLRSIAPRRVPISEATR